MEVQSANIDTGTRRFTMGKSEKLRHRTLVEGVFADGETFYDFPLRLTWRIVDGDTLEGAFCGHTPRGIGRVQMLITVPKKKRRRAVDRVLMRRCIREAYRLNRHILLDAVADMPQVGSVQLAFVFIHTDNIEYSKIEKKMRRLLGRVKNELDKWATQHCVKSE